MKLTREHGVLTPMLTVALAVALVLTMSCAPFFTQGDDGGYAVWAAAKKGATVKIQITCPMTPSVVLYLENSKTEERIYPDWSGPYYIDGKKVSKKKFDNAQSEDYRMFFYNGKLNKKSAKSALGPKWKAKMQKAGFNMNKKTHTFGTNNVFKKVPKGTYELNVESKSYRTVKVKSFTKTYKLKKLIVKKFIYAN